MAAPPQPLKHFPELIPRRRCRTALCLANPIDFETRSAKSARCLSFVSAGTLNDRFKRSQQIGIRINLWHSVAVVSYLLIKRNNRYTIDWH